MVFRSFPLPVRKFLGLIFVIAGFCLVCFATANIFSVAARKLSPPFVASSTYAVSMQATTTLLALRFENNSPNGEQGEIPVQASTVVFQPGVSGQGLYMDRGNRLTYTSEGNINSTEGTIELWLKPTWAGNDGQNHTILRYGASNGYMVLGKEGNDLRLALNRANENGSLELDVFTSIQHWQAEQWHHVAASWSNTGQFLRLYVDGILVSERLFAVTLPTISGTTNSTFQIGGDSVRYPLLAVIDDVNISDGARSAQEVASRMLQSLAVTSATLTPNITSIDLYPGWTYWQDFQYAANTSAGALKLPWQVAALTTSNSAVAIIDPLTGRPKAVAPGTAMITASFNGLQSVLTVNVLTPKKAAAEETVDTYLSTPATGHLYKIPVAIIRYFPTKDGTNVDATATGYTSTLDALRTRQTKVEKKLKFMLEEGSRFRGYLPAPPVPSLGYRVVKIINVYEEIPPGLPTATSGVYYPDYKQIFSRHNVKDLVVNQGVKEIWLEQYASGRIALDESNMASPVTGDVSSSLRTNDDLPVYAKSYTVFGINFAQGENNAARNRGHHLETLLTYANVLQDRNDVLFQESFIGRDTSSAFLQGRCGKTDRPPNSTSNFDFNNATGIESDIEDWFPDGRGTRKTVNNDTWGMLTYTWPETPDGKTEGQWYIYWRQAIPGLNNTITRLDTERMTNWWQFTADWDAAMQAKLGLTEPLSCQYSLSSASNSFLGTGGSSSVNIVCGATCKWFATTSEPWIKLTNTTGTGNGTINYTVEATTVARTGTIVIGGNAFTITQSNVVCTYTLSAASLNAAATASSGSVNVTTTAGCAWTATSNANWLTISSGSSGSGNGTVNFNIAANTGPARVGTLTIAGQTHTVNQSSGCTYSLSATNQTFSLNGGTSSVNLLTASNCPWSVTSNAAWITLTSSNNGTGNSTVNFVVAASDGTARTGTLTIAGQTLTITQTGNAAPTITPAAALTRQQSTTATAATIATVNDAETMPGNLIVTTTSVPPGISVTGLTNTSGTISAVVTASCSAALGANTVGLKVTDALSASALTNLTVNVTSSPNCFLQVADASASDQRIGSVLLYSYYTSNISAPALQNTQIRITNTHDTQDTAVRLYLVDGQFSLVHSLFLCLPPNQTANFLMSETDPDVSGYIIAVAVSKTTGCPTNFNYLMGGASVKLSSGHTANLGAIAVAALATNPTTCATGDSVATLNFDGTNYGRLPKMLALDSVPSLKDNNDTRLMLARIGGSLVSGASALGTLSGKIYNGNRASQDFTISAATPQLASSLSFNFPRLPTRLDTFIPAGQAGWLRLWTDNSIGIIGSVIILPANLRATRAFEGGYNLQQSALSPAVSLDIPVSVPTC